MRHTLAAADSDHSPSRRCALLILCSLLFTLWRRPTCRRADRTRDPDQRRWPAGRRVAVSAADRSPAVYAFPAIRRRRRDDIQRANRRLQHDDSAKPHDDDHGASRAAAGRRSDAASWLHAQHHAAADRDVAQRGEPGGALHRQQLRHGPRLRCSQPPFMPARASSRSFLRAITSRPERRAGAPISIWRTAIRATTRSTAGCIAPGKGTSARAGQSDD